MAGYMEGKRSVGVVLRRNMSKQHDLSGKPQKPYKNRSPNYWDGIPTGWEYTPTKEARRMMEEGKAEVKGYPPAVFLRLAKAGTSVYGFIPEGGVAEGHTLVVNRADLVALLKKEKDYAKMGILTPTVNSAEEL